jgi:hypothetical protein
LLQFLRSFFLLLRYKFIGDEIFVDIRDVVTVSMPTPAAAIIFTLSIHTFGSRPFCSPAMRKA